MNRYMRQTVLPEIGTDGQTRLGAANVLVIGAGGLGSHVLPALAGAGVGRLVIVDHDRVEISNLHRQPLFSMADLGAPKALAARDRILGYNPEITVKAHVTALTPETVTDLLADITLVADAADSLAVTYILSDACFAAGVPLVSASVLEQRGYVGAFCGGAPSYRAVFPDMPSSIGSCAENGVMGSAVGTIGSLQAHVALQILLGHAPSPLGRLISLDLKTMSFGGFQFLGAEEPVSTAPGFVSRSQLRPTDLIIELRDEIEAPVPAVAGARRILPADIAGAEFPRDARLVLCCRTGVRAFKAARLLRDRGFGDVTVLAAGAE
ncbi:molybdopterin/thiamine biosynthesis adenylyltransferase/rhodanese-related sulfurtransferase [Rhodoligotrophos appendicifer]|uniref:HesA/MoeB/ThiF family protein n=1 Tax=Rhodoligotrophos appendicifer TaxID=987056 RepID=UPI001185BABC|nr:HesA/MoeB/ThiF family protein [Rhodoligotrophos appendicifer]